MGVPKLEVSGGLDFHLIFAYSSEMPTSPILTAGTLRRDLSLRALRFARGRGLLHVVSDGDSPTVIFGCEEKGLHGNFHPTSYRALMKNAAHVSRMQKVHTASRRMALRTDWQWKELDCACSSDALLMNIFCHPAAMNSAALRTLLGVDARDQPVFGYKPGVPLVNGKADQTEVDMHVGSLLVEAKLTETDFQSATPAKLARYRDYEAVFGTQERELNSYFQRGYQVVRGILAANVSGCRFALLCDARRQDLIEIWYAVLSQVDSAELRSRILLVTWQEITATLPPGLQQFLADKYGL